MTPEPMTPAGVYLVRHAEDQAALERRFGDEALSEWGRRQASELGTALAHVPFGRCLCSPLRRALETAERALAGRDVPTEVIESLAEGSCGELEGLGYEEAAARYPHFFRLGRSVVPRLAGSDVTAPGGETRSAFLRRVDEAVARIEAAREASPGPLLVVSHGGLLNFALQRLLRMPPSDEVPFGFDHCGVVKLLRYREEPAFGPFTMLRFVSPAG
jgi:broad specificity phosphatase PhoE